MNDHLELERNFKNTYPSELQLKKENISTSEASILDNPFSIVSVPHLDSNIPSNYASIGSEILRLVSRTTSDINTFK